MKNITILGSTGSIGTQALEIIRNNEDKFSVSSLSCGSNIELLFEQIMEFKPRLAVTGDEASCRRLKEMLKEADKENSIGTELLYGEEGIIAAARSDSNIVLNALMGMRGLVPTLEAIETNHSIALANKETLVAGGHLVMDKAREYGVDILPVDSEHSAIFQCLEGNKDKKIKRILLTASGGPFRGWSKEEIKTVTPEMALKHPNWSMGKKITIDSATMMNKGLEIIEAMWLFGVDVNDIEVLVHPQSIVHSAVEFMDTAVLAQMGTPDMKVPISIALSYPERIDLGAISKSLDFFGKASELTFEKPDPDTFRCLGLAIQAAKAGGTYPAVMNGANEILVELFLQKKIGFADIPRIIEEIMEEHVSVEKPTLEDVLSSDTWARNRAIELCNSIDEIL